MLERPKIARQIVETNGIEIIPAATDILEEYFDLPVPTINGKRHSDPFDRIIIATAIRRGRVLVSRDSKFPWYQLNCKLSLLEI